MTCTACKEKAGVGCLSMVKVKFHTEHPVQCSELKAWDQGRPERSGYPTTTHERKTMPPLCYSAR